MKNENSDNKISNAFIILFNWLPVFAILGLFVALPIVLCTWMGITGIIVFAVLIIFTTPAWPYFFTALPKNYNPIPLLKALFIILTARAVVLILFFLFQVFIAFHFSFRTFIELRTLLLIYFGTTLFAITLSFFILRNFSIVFKNFILVNIVWLIINSVFILNSVFSKTPKQEVTHFKFSKQVVVETSMGTGIFGWRLVKQNSTEIILDSNKYQNYVDVRTFFWYENMYGADTITYTIAKGLFGWNVVKDYSFNLKYKPNPIFFNDNEKSTMHFKVDSNITTQDSTLIDSLLKNTTY
ncbi:MAG: hypothetical protein RL708_2545 [Bacteroidota bacterium]|jgi:hypothetical protein